MAESTADFQILIQFESTRRTQQLPLADFVASVPQKLTPDVQLELIAVDMEIRLKLGCSVSPTDYLLDFPHFTNQLPTIYRDVKSDFINSYCPIKACMGSVPTQFGEYLIEKELGRGGMGVVYLAQHQNSGLKFAMKILFVSRDAIFQEAQLTSQINHPSVCKIAEVGIAEDIPYMCCEYIQGESLKEKLAREHFLDGTEAAELVCEIARGIAKAHANGIAHFDLKPGNILIREDGQPFTADFGMALPAGKSDFNSSKEIFCSLLYMPPEFFNDEFGQPATTSDIYSLGVVLYELLTGYTPFRGDVKVIKELLCEYPPPRPRDFPDVEISPKLESICLIAISKYANDRYQSMDEFAQALSDWLATPEDRPQQKSHVHHQRHPLQKANLSSDFLINQL